MASGVATWTSSNFLNEVETAMFLLSVFNKFFIYQQKSTGN